MPPNQPAKNEEPKSAMVLDRVNDMIGGSFFDIEEINKRLAYAQKHCHLITPVSRIGALPDGFGIAVSVTLADIARDTYSLPGTKRGLLRPFIQRLGGMAGVSWDIEHTWCRSVNGHPYHWQAQAVGWMLDVSGQRTPIKGGLEMDFRDGSVSVDKVYADSKDGKSAEKTLREIRHFLPRHCESRASLRAIRSLGLSTSYESADLAKPFACVRLQWTGRSADPEMQRELTLMTARSFLGASAAMYGAPAPQTEARPLPQPTRHHVLPSGTADRLDLGHDPITGEVLDTRGEPVQVAQPRTQQRSAPARQQAPQRQREDELPAGRQGEGDGVFRFGKLKGAPLSEGEESDLRWYADALRKSIDDPEKSRFRDSNEAELRAAESELRRREGLEAEPPGDPGPLDDDSGW